VVKRIKFEDRCYAVFDDNRVVEVLRPYSRRFETWAGARSGLAFTYETVQVDDMTAARVREAVTQQHAASRPSRER
jgi:hypothetical protein